VADHGWVSIEVQHLLTLVRHNQSDTIYHEHFQYYTVDSATRALALGGLSVVDVELLPTHGGSIRLWARPEEVAGEPSGRMLDVLAEEKAAGLHELSGYTEFAARVARVRRELLQVLSPVEPREVQLGNEVVLVEDEAGALPLQHQRHCEQQVRRVAGVHHVDAPERAHLPGEPDGVPERGRVLLQVPGGPAGGRAQGVAVDVHPVDLGLRLGVPLRALWTDHVHVPARVAQCGALLPHPPVERHGKVLDEHERPAARAVLRRSFTRQGRRILPRSGAPRRRACGQGR
jgi:hypothetical protein